MFFIYMIYKDIHFYLISYLDMIYKGIFSIIFLCIFIYKGIYFQVLEAITNKQKALKVLDIQDCRKIQASVQLVANLINLQHFSFALCSMAPFNFARSLKCLRFTFYTFIYFFTRLFQFLFQK